MKLSQLGFFCAVVERGTIAAAAEQLHCVPSNITTRLRELEGQLGVALFNRERNRLLVTPEGRLLYRHAQRLARYRRESPGVELHIRPEHSLLLERLLMEGELDLIVTDGPIEHPLLASRLAFRERLLRVTPADLPAPTPEDLASLELYVFGHTCHYRRQVDRWPAESGIQPRATLEIESYPSLFACIEAGLGFACVPESFVARMPSARRGFHAEPVAGLDSSDIHFVWRKQQASPLIQGFIDSIGAD